MRFVLSDLDGVLVDSTAEVERVWREWAVEQGLDPDEVGRASHGVPAHEVIARLAPHLPVAEEAVRVDRIHAATGGTALPGAHELLGMPRLAVVTSCSRPLAAARLSAAQLPDPPLLITSEDTARGKPHPDPYLAGAAALGADPAECVVIEDSPAGVAAGRAAGMTVWAVATTHAPEELAAADLIAPDLPALLESLGPWT
jgi:mannitol-1-/sugar-/sorbitol-6-phosphatase